jgi:hypothetical protein
LRKYRCPRPGSSIVRKTPNHGSLPAVLALSNPEVFRALAILKASQQVQIGRATAKQNPTTSIVHNDA